MPGPRQDLRRQVHELAFRQSGYFTAAQARSIGFTYQAQKYHADHGNWIRVDRGMFRLPGWPSQPADSYARWSLWSGGRAVVSHDSALRVHDLSDVNPARVHLTVPPGFRAIDDAVVLHVGRLRDGDVEERLGGWRVTTPERSVADAAAAELPQEFVDDAVASGLERGLFTRRRLLRQAETLGDRAALRLERALAGVGR